nr:hypothetical protein CFP56_04298 [Quercus suber]
MALVICIKSTPRGPQPTCVDMETGRQELVQMTRRAASPPNLPLPTGLQIVESVLRGLLFLVSVTLPSQNDARVQSRRGEPPANNPSSFGSANDAWNLSLFLPDSGGRLRAALSRHPSHRTHAKATVSPISPSLFTSSAPPDRCTRTTLTVWWQEPADAYSAGNPPAAEILQRPKPSSNAVAAAPSATAGYSQDPQRLDCANQTTPLCPSASLAPHLLDPSPRRRLPFVTGRQPFASLGGTSDRSSPSTRPAQE